ncbi:MAG: hypothetical protein M3033_06185 [Acidobacteriota bacterium]|nr:hypothetical protein [Acidobacteriota bacterium]
MKKNFLLLAGLFVFFAATSATFAQSDDRDHPTLLRSNEITGNLTERSAEHFYSFVAGPGELTITLDVKAAPESQVQLSFELLERNAATSIICCEGAQGDGGGTGRDVKSVKLTRRQTVILHTTEGSDSGTFRIRLSGAAVGGGGLANTNKNDEAVENNRGGGNRSGNRINVPASGTLRIRMRDGSTKEIDLSLVREISVKP